MRFPFERPRPALFNNHAPTGAAAKDFTLSVPRVLVYFPKDPEQPTAEQGIANIGSNIFLTHSVAACQLNEEYTKIIWSVQYQRLPANQVVPIKPSVVMSRDLRIPKTKALVVSKAAVRV